MADMSDLGKRLEKARVLAGLKQEELAEKVGVTQQAISRIEEGKTKNPRNLKAIAAALNVSVNFLMSGDEDFIDSYRTDTEKGIDINRMMEIMSVLTSTQRKESISFMESFANKNEEILMELNDMMIKKLVLKNNQNHAHA